LNVEHNDNIKSNSDECDLMVDDDYNEYGSDFDDKKVARIIEEKNKKMQRITMLI